MQYNTTQYNLKQYNTIPYNAIHYDTISIHPTLYGTENAMSHVKKNELQYNIIQQQKRHGATEYLTKLN